MNNPLDAAEGRSIQSIAGVPNLEHGAITMRIGRYLDAYVDAHDLGRVFSSQTTFTFVGSPATRYPDLSFVARERLPQRLRVLADFAPDLAVGVVSESDMVNDVEEKVLQYHQSGVRLVWVIKPVFKTIEVYELAEEPRLLTINDNLTGDPVIPGFKVLVRALFS